MSIEETLQAILTTVQGINSRIDVLEGVIAKEPALMNVEQIADLMHVSHFTVRNLFHEGVLTDVGQGKRLVADRAQVMSTAKLGPHGARKRKRALDEINQHKKRREQANAHGAY